MIIWLTAFIDFILCGVYQWIDNTEEFTIATCLEMTLCDLVCSIPIGGRDWQRECAIQIVRLFDVRRELI